MRAGVSVTERFIGVRQFNTAREFETTAGTVAYGGSMDNVAVQFAGDMVYMQSGYSLFGQLPGNILLAFELGPTDIHPIDKN
jgi:polyvinyl alcohol dehydrogenase (cytochrome)